MQGLTVLLIGSLLALTVLLHAALHRFGALPSDLKQAAIAAKAPLFAGSQFPQPHRYLFN